MSNPPLPRHPTPLPRKMTGPETDMQNGHNHCRGSGKYRGEQHVDVEFHSFLYVHAQSYPRIAKKIDAESLAKFVV